jgi:vacuolar protein sorting-associated protein 1
MAEVYDSQKEQTRKALLATLCLEDGPFFTQNSHYYENTRSKWLETYRRMRRHHDSYRVSNYRARLSDHGVFVARAMSREEEALIALKRLGYDKIGMDDLERLHPPDEFDEELTVMADVRAYFQVAYKVRYNFARLL